MAPTKGLLLFGLSLLLTACGGGGGGSSSSLGGSGGSSGSDPCGISAQIDFIERTAQTYYYWYDELATVNKANYDDPELYLQALMEPIWFDGSGRDKEFSYVTSISDDEARFTNRTYYGFGFSYVTRDNETIFYFSDSFEGSPAHEAGIRRGQRLLEIDRGNGFESWESLRELDPSVVFGPSDSSVTRIFKVDDNGVVRDINVTKAELSVPPIAGEPLLIPSPNGNAPIGYINFRTFTLAAFDWGDPDDPRYPIYPEDHPLPQAARSFKAAGVTDLVIDLRYNGGGLLSVASAFLDLLAGNTADEETSFILKYNDNPNKSDDFQDFSVDFAPLPDTFSPLRIAFIVTGASASASELLINSLDPFVEVAMFGADTSGKAVGQSRFDLDRDRGCDMALRLISFEIQNGLGQGGYWNGLDTTGRFDLYPAVDDVTRSFGDIQEDSLQTALSWLNGTLTKDSTQASKRVTNTVRFAPFNATWPMRETPPLNPDGSIRVF